MLIIKIIKIKCSNPSRILNEHASILVYKFRPERTGFNMYAEYTQPQLTFLTLQPWHKQSILMYLGVECIEIYASITKVRLKITIYIKLVFFVSDNRPKNNGI